MLFRHIAALRCSFAWTRDARKQWGTGFVKSIFLTSQWSSFKNPKYPYQVMHRSMDVDFIVKEGDNYFIYHWV
ncbi:MAG: hypothetical protein SPH89_09235, partial [Candidatus Limisoma sp.]|nr:hypothetical protein [Candidatus Limisoma sp.]